MHLSIVLVAPARAENIGAAARAMKTTDELHLRIDDDPGRIDAAAWNALLNRKSVV